MRRIVRNLLLTVPALLLGGMLPAPPAAIADEAAMAKEGKSLAFNRKKGNCLACHAIDDGVSPGNIGPPLVQMSSRFPNKAAMRDQIWDATKRNPGTPMPPFGRHKILSEGDIDRIAAFIWPL
ncbi:MAG: sulfur oxidation c-type cytochrome SoxX [Gammaproteobacteria bacterium]|nr:MAG: sulfur oxidation c-type cytochrome SoxX [Gammaproteobacteria bacterium]